MTDSSELLVDPIDILAHLFFATGTADRVIVTANGRVFEAAFRAPDGDGVLLACAPSATTLPAGTAVQVEYVGPTDEYGFESTVVTHASGTLRLAMPRAIERHDRRVTPRVVVPENAGVYFTEIRLDGRYRFAVADLSDGGVGLVDNDSVLSEPNQKIRGQLYVPNLGALECVLEVRHIRPNRGMRQVGTRFLELNLEARADLARVLRMWEKAYGSQA